MADKTLTMYIRDSASSGVPAVDNKIIIPAEKYRWEYREDENPIDIPDNSAAKLFADTDTTNNPNGDYISRSSILLGYMRTSIIVSGAFTDLSATENTNATGVAAITGAVSGKQLRENFIIMVHNQNGFTDAASTGNYQQGTIGPIFLGIPNFRGSGATQEFEGYIKSYYFEEESALDNHYPFSFSFELADTILE